MSTGAASLREKLRKQAADVEMVASCETFRTNKWVFGDSALQFDIQQSIHRWSLVANFVDTVE